MPADPTTLRAEAARIGGGVGVMLSQAADRIEELERECARLASVVIEASARDLWITYDPETGYEQHNTEADGWATLDVLLDEHIDRAAESVHEQVESVALYRCTRVAGIVQTITATSEDDTEEGAWCRDRGFDYKVELSIGRKDDR